MNIMVLIPSTSYEQTYHFENHFWTSKHIQYACILIPFQLPSEVDFSNPWVVMDWDRTWDKYDLQVFQCSFDLSRIPAEDMIRMEIFATVPHMSPQQLPRLIYL